MNANNATMDIGHPVTLKSGAHGIITAISDGMTKIDLIGGAEVRVPLSSLRSYFDNPMPGNDEVMQAGRDRANFSKLVRNRKRA